MTRKSKLVTWKSLTTSAMVLSFSYWFTVVQDIKQNTTGLDRFVCSPNVLNETFMHRDIWLADLEFHVQELVGP